MERKIQSSSSKRYFNHFPFRETAEKSSSIQTIAQSIYYLLRGKGEMILFPPLAQLTSVPENVCPEVQDGESRGIPAGDTWSTPLESINRPAPRLERCPKAAEKKGHLSIPIDNPSDSICSYDH
ncbi:hypothetical protein AVEN_267800-1 [Araneus ventricosus]|uniref:Uncharacterized protein n=1 Tax=Araneus ventricosus TaxID=182803 RepID=A0A4Y2D3F0_ARAVE|nr:hypothetical protein AVEN_267800-1 [Araneus ventricosus]